MGVTRNGKILDWIDFQIGYLILKIRQKFKRIETKMFWFGILLDRICVIFIITHHIILEFDIKKQQILKKLTIFWCLMIVDQCLDNHGMI